MDWKYALKRKLGNRFALTAVLFLAITLWGSVTVLTGVLGGPSYRGFAKLTAPVKSDPGVPTRALQAPAAAADPSDPNASYAKTVRAKTAQAEQAVTHALEEDHTLIQLFGLYQSLADRTVVEDSADPQYAVVKLPNGSLTFTGEGDPDPKAQAAELKRLQMALADRGASLLYLQAPSKLDPAGQSLPLGVTDASNACADRLLYQLDALGVDHLDFRQSLKDAGGDWSHWFYATDHHWTQEAAFLCFRDLCARLETYTQTTSVSHGAKTAPISIPQRYTDPNSYASATLSGFFLGSQGKRVGSLYAGADDFVLHTPAFPTLLRYETGSDGLRRGDAEDTVLFPERVEQRDWFSATPYTYYAGGDYPIAYLSNYYNPQGPRVLLIRDSYACAMTPYLALISSQLTTVDPRSFSGNLLEYVDWLKPDVVLVLYSSGMVRSEDYFRLLPQPASSKGDVLRWKEDRLEEDK